MDDIEPVLGTQVVGQTDERRGPGLGYAVVKDNQVVQVKHVVLAIANVAVAVTAADAAQAKAAE